MLMLNILKTAINYRHVFSCLFLTLITHVSLL